MKKEEILNFREKIEKVIENKFYLVLMYGLLLLFQYIIIVLITWRLESVYFVSLTFSLMLLFILFSAFFISLILALVVLWILFYQSWLLILFYICMWWVIWILLIYLYRIIDYFSSKHAKKFDDIFNKVSYYHSKLTLWIGILFFISVFILYWNELFVKSKEILIEKELWKEEQYKLRFFNNDYYFLETKSWSIKIYDKNVIKSIEFKK